MQVRTRASRRRKLRNDQLLGKEVSEEKITQIINEKVLVHNEALLKKLTEFSWQKKEVVMIFLLLNFFQKDDVQKKVEAGEAIVNEGGDLDTIESLLDADTDMESIKELIVADALSLKVNILVEDAINWMIASIEYTFLCIKNLLCLNVTYILITTARDEKPPGVGIEGTVDWSPYHLPGVSSYIKEFIRLNIS